MTSANHQAQESQKRVTIGSFRTIFRCVRNIKTLCVILISAFLSVVSASAQSAPQSDQQAPGYYRARLGAFEMTVLSDGTAPRHLDQILSRPDIANAEFAADHEKEPIELSINAYLIDTGTHKVLIDTGAGELFGAASGKLIANLKAAGVLPGQIDTILLTHIHADHSGGLAVKGVMQFPNANVYVSRRDVEEFVSRKDTPDESADLQRIVRQSRATIGLYVNAKKVVCLDHDGPVLPGITSRSQPGHTPGHTAYLVESEGHKMLFWGDIVHAAEVQFAHSEITVQYDIDQREAAAQRLREFQFAAKTGVVVASDHISFPGLGHVRKTDSGYQWCPIPYSASVTEIDPK
jgi:glyoxylase-like metal-dependent hydrolase (beta-lactamase superfamily II)